MGIAIALLLFVAVLLPVGTILFLGEWLFGSIGWGVLHGTLLFVAAAVALVLGAVGLRGGSVARSFLLALLVGIAVAVLFGLDLSNQAWSRLGESVAPTIDPAVRPLAVATAAGAIVLAIVGLLAGARGGGMGGAIGGLVAGAIVGAVIGAFSAITFGVQVGVAIGVAVGLIAWIVFLGISVARQGIDTDALKARFYPTETIDTTKETIEWVRAQIPLGPKS